jgi:hypothetical protein
MKDQEDDHLVEICLSAFLFIHQVTNNEFNVMKKELTRCDATQLQTLAYQHKNKGTPARNRLTSNQINVVGSLVRWAQNNIAEPYAGVKSNDRDCGDGESIVYILPAWLNITRIYNLATILFHELNIKPFGIRRFRELWKESSTHLIKANRRTTACDQCTLFKSKQKTYSRRDFHPRFTQSTCEITTESSTNQFSNWKDLMEAWDYKDVNGIRETKIIDIKETNGKIEISNVPLTS